MSIKYQELTAEDYAKAKTDEEYLNKVYNANQGLIGLMQKKLATNILFDESEAHDALVDGLINAINTYDGTKNVKFSAYATKCMFNRFCRVFNLHNSNKTNVDPLLRLTTLSLEQTICENEDFNTELTLAGVLTQDEDLTMEEAHNGVLDAEKLKLFLTETEQYYFEEIAKGKSRTQIAFDNALPRQIVAERVRKAQRRIKLLIDSANEASLRLRNGERIAKISEDMNLNDAKDIVRLQEIYGYLYNAQDPTYPLKDFVELAYRLARKHSNKGKIEKTYFEESELE